MIRRTGLKQRALCPRGGLSAPPTVLAFGTRYEIKALAITPTNATHSSSSQLSVVM